MAQDHSFDVVSEVNQEEVQNAVHMGMKEVHQRYDFKGSSANIELRPAESALLLVADNDLQLKSLVDLLRAKLAKRGVSQRALAFQEINTTPSGQVKQEAKIQQGIPQDTAKKIVKTIKDQKLKVQASIRGETVRVSGKKIDELQQTIQHLKSDDFGLDLQYENLR